MIYYLLTPFKDVSIIFNVFRYITFRAVAASVTAFLICIVLFPLVIQWLSRLSMLNETKREHADKIHDFYAQKAKVPTLGGILIVVSILLSTVFWAEVANPYIIISLMVVAWYGLIGFIDDWKKLKQKNSCGLAGKTKLLAQVILGLGIGFYLQRIHYFPTELYVPFFKHVMVPMGFLFIPFIIIVLSGSSNALNLIDGQDGLAIGCTAFAAGAFTILTYAAGRADFSEYLGIPFIPGSGELAVFCAAVVGASVGFLWYNSFPATVMMGDTGSLSLGGALGIAAILIKHELVLLIVGGVFVWEALSVMIQVTSFKLFKRRVFLMSPFHHHLQISGWSESKIIIRFWIIAIILALLTLTSLKIR